MKETCWSPPTAYRFEKAGKDVQRTGRKESQQLKWGIETQKKLETRDTSIPKTVVWRLLTMKNGEENGNPLQYSCLENPRDGGAWWAAIYGVAQSRTWLKRLSSGNNEKTWLKTQNSKNCDHGITSWQTDGETMETVRDCIFLGSKITVDWLQPWN